MKKVAHVHYGDANSHPIIMSYIMNPVSENTVIDSSRGSKFDRLISLFKSIKYSGPFDFFHCHDIFSTCLCLILKPRSRVIFDAHEVYYDYLKSQLLRNLGYYFEKFIHIASFTSIFPNKYRAEHFRLKGSQYHVIENLLNDAMIEKESIDTLETLTPKYANKVKVALIGTINEHRGISAIINAVNMTDFVELDYYGNSFTKIENVQTLRIKNKGVIGRAELLKRYKNYDLSFALYDHKSVNNHLCAPTKLFENEYFDLCSMVNDSPYINMLIKEKRIINIIKINNLDEADIIQVFKELPGFQKTKNINKKRLLWTSQNEYIKAIYVQ